MRQLNVLHQSFGVQSVGLRNLAISLLYTSWVYGSMVEILLMDGADMCLSVSKGLFPIAPAPLVICALLLFCC